MGYVHGDISPYNLVATDSTFNNIKIVDFSKAGLIGNPINIGNSFNTPFEHFKRFKTIFNSSYDSYSLGITLFCIE